MSQNANIQSVSSFLVYSSLETLSLKHPKEYLMNVPKYAYLNKYHLPQAHFADARECKWYEYGSNLKWIVVVMSR